MQVLCGGLNENVPYRLICSNTLTLVGESVLRRIRKCGVIRLWLISKILSFVFFGTMILLCLGTNILAKWYHCVNEKVEKDMYDVGFSSVCYAYVLLHLVNKEAALALARQNIGRWEN